jgi:hypothetical protein
MNWFIAEEMFVTKFGFYSAFGAVSLLLWLAIYQLALARRYSVLEAIFGTRPNAAVALDVVGGMLAAGILFLFILRHPTSREFWPNALTAVKTMAALLILLAVLRILLDGLLHIWFGTKRDAQGDFVTLNNELFKQGNLATSIFSTSLYLILVAGMLQLELRYSYKFQVAGVLNMLGIWLLGGAVVLLHSFFLLGYGTRNNILHECFHDNNPAAATSLLGLTGGFLLLSNHILGKFRPGIHIFDTEEIWMSVGMMLLFVLIARAVLQLLVYAVTGISLREELVVRDNVAWGIVDGGLILILCLILISFM